MTTFGIPQKIHFNSFILVFILIVALNGCDCFLTYSKWAIVLNVNGSIESMEKCVTSKILHKKKQHGKTKTWFK